MNRLEDDDALPAADVPLAAPGTGAAPGVDFIREIIAADRASGKHATVISRFPPEPNGYLHIGHAKSICLNFGVAAENGGRCHLRFDDTNPETEDPEFVDSILADVRWLGFDWGPHLYYASDYFERFWDAAVELVEAGLAYVDDSSDEEIKGHRGTVTEAGRPTPFRDRPVAENLDLLHRMRAGEFSDGACVLRAKIDLAAANMKMRDPLLYRIRHAHHYRTGDAWCIYPMYDFAHPLSDAYEEITHSLCTLEFENNREIYDWLVEHVTLPARPRQIEFARLNLTYTVLSKRWLLTLVHEGHVAGWDDPRMPTLSGLRRRGVTPEAIRAFCDAIGVAKANSLVDVGLFEHAVRDDLNAKAPRVLAVLRPLELIVENFPEGEVDWLAAPYWPRDIGREGGRDLPFSRTLWIERDDFAEVPPKGFHRLSPGAEVRLRYGYLVRCTGVEKDPATGEVTAVRCAYDPETRGGTAPDGRRVPGTIHWVSAAHAVPVAARLYDRLFHDERPAVGEKPLAELLNPASLEVLEGWGEPGLAAAAPGERYQFERHAYFYVDPVDSAPGRPAFNRIVSLKDGWVKVAQPQPAPPRRERKPKEPAEAAPPPAIDLGPLTDADRAVLAVVERLVAAHPREAEQVRAGRTGVAGYFVGLAMKETGGQADPRRVRGLVERALNP